MRRPTADAGNHSTTPPRSRRLRRAVRRLLPAPAPTPAAGLLREDDLVWIMGSPRTGSTWLLNLLGGLTNGVRVDEPLIAPLFATPTTVIPGWPDRDELLHDVARARPNYVFADVHEGIWAPALRALLLQRFSSGIPPRRDRSVVLVKEPHGAAGAPVLMRVMSRSRLLFLQRDGRDVVDSIVDAVDGGWATEREGIVTDQHGSRDALIRSCAHDWVRDTDAVSRAYDAHHPRRRIAVRYEDLRARPVEELARLLDWLDRPVDRSLIAEVVDLLDFDRIPETERGPGKFQRAARPGLWRDHFDAAEQALLDQIMGPTLDRLGYTTAGVDS